MDFYLGWTQDPSIARTGKDVQDHSAGPGSFSLPQPDIVPQGTGELAADADYSAALFWKKRGDPWAKKHIQRAIGRNSTSRSKRIHPMISHSDSTFLPHRSLGDPALAGYGPNAKAAEFQERDEAPSLDWIDAAVASALAAPELGVREPAPIRMASAAMAAPTPHETSPFRYGRAEPMRVASHDLADTVDESLAFQAAPSHGDSFESDGSHAHLSGRMAADREILPANVGRMRPNGRIDRGAGVDGGGVPSSADKDFGLRHLPSAIHTVPHLLRRDAAAQGVKNPMSVSRDERLPKTDRFGFRFADRHRTDFAKPKFYPARGGDDKILYENAAKFAPDYQADFADRRLAMMADRIPEPINARKELMHDIAFEMTHHRDPYLRPRTGPSVTKPGQMAQPPSWYVEPGTSATPNRFGGASLGRVNFHG